MRVSDEFRSQWLQTTDLPPNPHTLDVTITGISSESVFLPGQKRMGQKWALAFQELERALLLNRTNAEALARLLGDDSDGWINRRVRLQVQRVKFGNDWTDAIRVCPDDIDGGGSRKALEPAQAARLRRMLEGLVSESELLRMIREVEPEIHDACLGLVLEDWRLTVPQWQVMGDYVRDLADAQASREP